MFKHLSTAFKDYDEKGLKKLSNPKDLSARNVGKATTFLMLYKDKEVKKAFTTVVAYNREREKKYEAKIKDIKSGLIKTVRRVT